MWGPALAIAAFAVLAIFALVRESYIDEQRNDNFWHEHDL